MSSLSPQQSQFIDRFVKASARLVVLQNLKQAYEVENRAQQNKQINKNFRTSAILDVIRDILEEQTETMIYFVDLEENPGLMHTDHIINMQTLMSELTDYYAWACEQVKLKSLRQSLINTEPQFDELF